jgi:hypothetical protein
VEGRCPRMRQNLGRKKIRDDAISVVRRVFKVCHGDHLERHGLARCYKQ